MENLKYFYAGDRWFYGAAKRPFDFLLALLLLLLCAPLMLLIAATIKLNSNGSVLFRQKRFGLNGTPFTMYKFRTMVEGNWDNAHYVQKKEVWEASHARRRKKEPLGHAERRRSQSKRVEDALLIRFGGFLRKSSFDELPQLFNVLKGDMSMVGPRPAMPHEVTLYEDYKARRLSVLPGLTGLWQVSGRAHLNHIEMVKLDMEYIDRRGFLADLKIISKTLSAMFDGV